MSIRPRVSLCPCLCFFFFNDTATTEIYTLSLHDALPIWCVLARDRRDARRGGGAARTRPRVPRSEEHTSELQSQSNLVCRLLLEKKKQQAMELLCRSTLSKRQVVRRDDQHKDSITTAATC